MKFINKKIASIVLAIATLMTATSIPVVSAVTKNAEKSSAQVQTQSVANSYGLVDDVQKGQILQCWNWSYNGMKNNMKKIAEQGFSAIQTSPVQGLKEGTTGRSMKDGWWVCYQPINFNIDTASNNSLGSKSDFKAMCDEAHKYGIKVIVDAVLNHMANRSGNDLSDKIISDIKNDSSCWHSITTNTSNWNDRYDITHNCMDGLPDLNTGNSKIQNYAIAFLKECIDVGVDGFRFDGAKHIEVPADRSGVSSQFWPNVLNAATSYAQSTRSITPYYYGEVLDETGGVAITGYTQYMSVTDNGLSNDIRNKINDRNASGAANTYIGKGAAANKAVQWNESHDTYAGGSSINCSTTVLNKTWAIVGSKSEVCGMYFARPNNISSTMGAADVTAWANKEVQAVNQFKNAFVGQSECLSSEGSIAYNERGDSGVVLVNCNGESQNVSVTAKKMKAGTYKDVITGNPFTVSGGKISGQIGSTGIAVVYSGVKQPANTISQAGGNFKTDTLPLTLGLENATSGTYQIGSEGAKTYTGTTTVTIGSGMSYGSSITIKLTATGEGGTTSASYTFKKVDPTDVRIIDFSNDHTVYLWNTAKWTTQNCYSWPTGGDGAIEWPGSGMTKVDTFGGSDLYKFTIPATDTNLIFNNNTDDSGKTPNLTLPTDMVVYDNGKGTWVDANSIDEDVLASRTGIVTTTTTTKATTTAPQPTSTDSGKTYLYGDVDLNGTVNVKDATIVQKVSAKISTINDVQKKAADVNGDGNINVKDATLLQKYSAKLVSSFAVGVSFTIGGTVVTTSTTVTIPTVTTTSTPPSSDVVITIKDNTPQGWLADADAKFILVDTSSNKEYEMTKTGDGWQASVPASVTNIKFNRNNPENPSETWNFWDAGSRGSNTTYTATSNNEGSWS